MPEEEKTLDQLEDQAAGTAVGSDIALDKKGDERIVHVDKEDERIKQFGNRSFEKIMMSIGLAIVLSMFVLIFIFYNTVEVRKVEEESLSAKIEQDFFEKYIADKDYNFSFKLGSTVYEYDPLLNTVEKASSSQGVGPVSSKSTGGFRANGSRILDGSGKQVLELGDPAVAIDTVLVTPDGNFVIFDTDPADAQAQAKWGLRLGAYELHVESEDVETLVSDASPGVSDPSYYEAFVEILSISPNGRYVAYTNSSSLWLYDRLSGASVKVQELSNPTTQPDTGWHERPSSDDSA